MIDLRIGDNHNSWTYIDKSAKPRYGVFQCECGTVKEVFISSVLNGSSKSCGCKMLNKFGIPSNDYQSIYSAWRRMKRRCYNPDDDSWDGYGGRGITVCEEWLNSASSFVEWALDNGWKQGLTLDRKNVNGNYEPSNCCWATWKEQGRNRRPCLYFTHDGKTRCMSEWCEIFGIPHYLACHRHARGVSDFDIIFYQGDLRGR